MDDTARILLLGLFAPAAIGAASGLLVWRVIRWGCIITIPLAALALGWTISQYGLLGPFTLPAHTADTVLRVQIPLTLLFGLAAMGVALCRGHPTEMAVTLGNNELPSVWYFSRLAMAIGAVSAFIIIRNTSPAAMWTASTLLSVALASAAAPLLTWPLAHMAAEHRQTTVGVILILLACAIAAALLGTGSQALALATIGLAPLAAGMLAVRPFARRPLFWLPLIATAAGTLVGPLFVGIRFSSTPHWMAWLLISIPLCAFLAGKLLGGAPGTLRGGAIRILTALIIAAAAVTPSLVALYPLVSGPR